eukprot:scaffold385_cov305-Pinguiococcus_pyrenoidosus.AAC.34
MAAVHHHAGHRRTQHAAEEHERGDERPLRMRAGRRHLVQQAEVRGERHHQEAQRQHESHGVAGRQDDAGGLAQLERHHLRLGPRRNGRSVADEEDADQLRRLQQCLDEDVHLDGVLEQNPDDQAASEACELHDAADRIDHRLLIRSEPSRRQRRRQRRHEGRGDGHEDLPAQENVVASGRRIRGADVADPRPDDVEYDADDITSEDAQLVHYPDGREGGQHDEEEAHADQRVDLERRDVKEVRRFAADGAEAIEQHVVGQAGVRDHAQQEPPPPKQLERHAVGRGVYPALPRVPRQVDATPDGGQHLRWQDDRRRPLRGGGRQRLRAILLGLTRWRHGLAGRDDSHGRRPRQDLHAAMRGRLSRAAALLRLGDGGVHSATRARRMDAEFVSSPLASPASGRVRQADRGGPKLRDFFLALPEAPPDEAEGCCGGGKKKSRRSGGQELGADGGGKVSRSGKLMKRTVSTPRLAALLT